MKIIYLYQYFGTPQGSWSTRVYEFTKRWVELGHEVTVVTSPYDKSDIKAQKFIERSKIEGINIIVINAGDSNRYTVLKRALNAILFSMISSYYAIFIKADVIIASSGPITIGIPGLFGKWFSKKKLVFEIRDLWPLGAIEMGLINPLLGKIGLEFEKLIYSQSTFLVTCSIGMENNIKRRFPNIDCITIPNVANEELINNSEFENDFYFPCWLDIKKHKVFLYAGSIGRMDAVEEVIHAFFNGQIPKEMKIVIIGEGVDKIYLEQLVREKQLENSIYFLGLLPKTEVVQWYKIAAFSFVLFKDYPVLSTSSPNKLFDSIAYGVPIIHNTTGWIKDLVDDENIGISVKPNSPQMMNEALQQAIDNLHEYRNALNLVKARYSIQTIALNYENKLKSLTIA